MLNLIQAADGIMTNFYTEYGYNLLALIPALVHVVIFNAMLTRCLNGMRHAERSEHCHMNQK